MGNTLSLERVKSSKEFDKALQKIKEVKNNLNIDTIKMDTSCLVGISSDIFKNVSTKIFTKGAK